MKLRLDVKGRKPPQNRGKSFKASQHQLLFLLIACKALIVRFCVALVFQPKSILLLYSSNMTVLKHLKCSHFICSYCNLFAAWVESSSSEDTEAGSIWYTVPDSAWIYC